MEVLPHFHLIVDMQTPRVDVEAIACQHLEFQMGIKKFEILKVFLVQSGVVDSPMGKLAGMRKYLVAYENLQLPN